jgi:hypothetical protein
MFGIIRPCRHRLGGELAAAWTAQLCGLCLALRDDYGQTARIAANYDEMVSLLVEAQSLAQPTSPTPRAVSVAGMRRADVTTGDCVRPAAAVSLALVAARVRDHVDDRDGRVGVVGVRPAARRVAERWVGLKPFGGHRLRRLVPSERPDDTDDWWASTADSYLSVGTILLACGSYPRCVDLRLSDSGIWHDGLLRAEPIR